MKRRSLLSLSPPVFAIHAIRKPATASSKTPAPVLLSSAPHVPAPLTFATLLVTMFHAYTRLHTGPCGWSP